MMPETDNITESIQCPDCGSAVRPGASFCFKCGKHFEIIGASGTAIGESGPAENEAENKAGTEQDFQDTISDSPKTAETAPAEEGGTPLAAEDITGEDGAETENRPVAIASAVRAKSQLTSAAAMRRKPKPQREKIEMVWEQPEGTSNPVFVIGTIVIFVLVLLIVLLVYLMK